MQVLFFCLLVLSLRLWYYWFTEVVRLKKKAFIILLLLVLLTVAVYFYLPHLPPIHRGQVYLDYSHSHFQDFMEIDDMAYSRCGLTIINETNQKTYVRISATASLFDRHNLYAQKELTGYTLDMQTNIFSVEPGENRILVYFGAPYGGTYQRGSKSLPWNIRVKVVENNDPGIIAVAQEQYFGGRLLLSATDITSGNNSAEYDVDGDHRPERLDICITDTAYENRQSSHLQLSLYDEGIQVDVLEVPLWSGTSLADVLIYDFGFEDGSLELILQLQKRYSIQFAGQDPVDYEESAVSLIRIVNGRLITDTGSIYGSGGYHVEPAEIYSGKLHSISGNRVTIEGYTMPPIRIDLDETLPPTA